MTPYTPGPLTADGAIVRIASGYRQGQMVADCSMLVSGDANAHLFALAPEMARILRDLIDEWRLDKRAPKNFEQNMTVLEARALLARLDGGAA